MTRENEKYKLFTNYLHNELGITKEDIIEWTKEAINEVATKYVENSFSSRSFDDRIGDLIQGRYSDRMVSDQLAKEVAKLITENMIEIKLK